MGGAGSASYTVPSGQYAKISVLWSGATDSTMTVNSNAIENFSILGEKEYILLHSGDVIALGDASSYKGQFKILLFNNPQ